MKKLIQMSLMLLLVSSAAAQESPPQQPQKTLHVYDWKDPARQHELSGGDVISMDGNSVLKIENTNNVPLEVSLLKISDLSVIKKAYFFNCEMKHENVLVHLVEHTNRLANFRDKYITAESSTLKLINHIPPSAPGGDERTNTTSRYFEGTSNWKLYELPIDRGQMEGLPTQLELKLSLATNGTVYLRPVKLLGVVSSSWWPAEQGGMVGGVVGIFGGIIGCFGGLVGCLAGFGKARKLVLTTTKAFIALGMLLTITGIVAILCKQPYFVWYVFILPGVVLTLVFSLNFPLIQRRYDDLEIRRMASIDAMRG